MSDYLKVTPREGTVFTYADLRRAMERAEALGVDENEQVRVVAHVSFSLNPHGVLMTAVFIPVHQ